MTPLCLEKWGSSVRHYHFIVQRDTLNQQTFSPFPFFLPELRMCSCFGPLDNMHKAVWRKMGKWRGPMALGFLGQRREDSQWIYCCKKWSEFYLFNPLFAKYCATQRQIYSSLTNSWHFSRENLCSDHLVFQYWEAVALSLLELLPFLYPCSWCFLGSNKSFSNWNSVLTTS